MFKSLNSGNISVKLSRIKWSIYLFFQPVIFFLEYREPMYSLRRSVFGSEYRGLLLENLSLRFINIFLETRNFLLKRWYRFRFEVRAFYWFVFHGLILHRDDDD